MDRIAPEGFYFGIKDMHFGFWPETNLKTEDKEEELNNDDS